MDQERSPMKYSTQPLPFLGYMEAQAPMILVYYMNTDPDIQV